MVTKKGKVTALEVQNFKAPGRYSVGGGLYLQIEKRYTSKSWVFRYRDRSSGKLKSKGLGRYPTLSLAEARIKADSYRLMLIQGADPIQTERANREAARSKSKVITFGDCVSAYIEAHKPSWRNEKHHAQWANTLNTYALRLIKKPVSDVTKVDVLACLTADNFWQDKTETATRVRQRIETVIDYAKASDLYIGENPARWRGNLKELLPAPGKLKDVKHHPALGYAEMPKFMALLVAKGAFSDQGSLSIKSLALVILTACRVNEAVKADWKEFDLKAKTWTIPKTRMKANRDHIVPLSANAIQLLKTLHPQQVGFLFANGATAKGQSRSITDQATRKCCQDINPDITVHGFRSTFRDWAADMTAYPREVAEAALAHTLSDKTEAAYRRSDLLRKRALLMAEWSKYCFAHC